jgi:hypothetical protein
MGKGGESARRGKNDWERDCGLGRDGEWGKNGEKVGK